MADPTHLTGADVLAAGLDDWRLLNRALHAQFATDRYADGLALVARIGAAAEAADHHPDLDLRYGHVNVRLYSHDVGGVTDRDVAMACTISGLAAEVGARPETDDLTVVEIALDAAQRLDIRAFWVAVLGMSVDPNEEVVIVDRDGSRPTLWLQATEPHDEPRQRFHVDVHVPHDRAAARIEAALAAGGTLVTDEYAPSFWVLADAEGNKACVCTWQDLPAGA